MISQVARRALLGGLQQRLASRFSQPPVKRIEMFINDTPYQVLFHFIQVEPHLTIFQACKENGVTIPRFCYH